MNTATDTRVDCDVKAVLTGNYSIQEAEGIVECFAAGIGNKDRTGDIIVPGAFTKTLQTIKPRVVWGHDWNHPIGKVLEIYEVGPDDPRLPAKMRESRTGGLYCKVQFNLKSEKGREAFHQVLFFGAEQEWSIGYKTKDSEYDGRLQATLLKEIALYEISVVLHGANFMTGTISVKSAESMDDPEDDDVDDEVVSRGIAMLKSFCDENPDWIDEVEKECGSRDKLKEKVGPGNIQAVQDAVGGDVLHGRGPHRGNLGDLLDYWRPIMKKPGGFRRCLVILADHPELGPLPNLCAWLHHETTGKWPNEGNHSKRGKSLEVNTNPATGEYALLAKALSDHFGGSLTLQSANAVSVEYVQEKDGLEGRYVVKYSNSDGKYLFSTPEVVPPKKESCGCGGDCCKTEKSLISELDEMEEKAGRVINSSNSEKIRQALSLLREVLSSGGLEMEVKTPIVEVTSGEPGMAKALMIVGKFHGDEQLLVDGTVMNIEVKSEQHLKAVGNVLSAFGAEFGTTKEIVA